MELQASNEEFKICTMNKDKQIYSQPNNSTINTPGHAFTRIMSFAKSSGFLTKLRSYPIIANEHVHFPQKRLRSILTPLKTKACILPLFL